MGPKSAIQTYCGIWGVWGTCTSAEAIFINYCPRTKYEGRYCFHRCLFTFRGGVPHRANGGGTPSQVQVGEGVPCPRSRWGIPIPGPGYPGLDGVPPSDLGWGTPLSRTGWGTPFTWTWSFHAVLGENLLNSRLAPLWKILDPSLKHNINNTEVSKMVYIVDNELAQKIKIYNNF